MAGDLFIMNITEDEMKVIEKAGGQIDRNIHHSNRVEPEAFNTLRNQLNANKQNRNGLPPHAYIRFTRNNYIQSPLLENFLAKVSRPLGVVTNQPTLSDWNQIIHDRTKYIAQALEKITVTLEYYQYGGKDLLKAPFANQFNRIPERI
jgi:hypothetical protein